VALPKTGIPGFCKRSHSRVNHVVVFPGADKQVAVCVVPLVFIYVMNYDAARDWPAKCFFSNQYVFVSVSS